MRGALTSLVLALVLAPAASGGEVERGRALFEERCSLCHGFDARGVTGVGPSLHGAGAESADFYLSTGRMPLDAPTGSEPLRSDPAYGRADIAAIVAYVASLGGPPVPTPHPERGSLAEGRAAYTSFCAGCHQIVGEGGVVTGAVPPALDGVTAAQIAEAVRIGPYVMPAFGPGVIDERTLDSIVRYIEYTRHPDDRGGWSIGHIGPIPEGMIAWLLAGGALLLAARLIGERQRR